MFEKYSNYYKIKLYVYFNKILLNFFNLDNQDKVCF